jgi:transcriptional antiterminator
VIQELLREKGHLSVASLTVAEFIKLLDTYKEDKQFGEKQLIVERKDDHLVDMTTLQSKIGVSRTTIYRMRQKGRLPEYIVNGQPKFNVEEVLRALKIESN